MTQTTTSAAGVTTQVATTTLLSAPAATGLFAVVGIAKAIGFGLLLREASGRGKRSAEVGSLSVDSSFSIISQLEPAQCYRRLVCDVATGKLPNDEVNEVILAPLAGKVADANVAAQSFDYLVAAENGRNFGDIAQCELRYHCPLTGDQLRELFREA